jgi:type IV secretory pathway VirB10-like protein
MRLSPVASLRPSRGLAAALAALCALIVGLSWSPSALAQWKWRDANGQLTASDRAPPKDIPEKDILTRPNTAPVRRFVPPPAPDAAASAPASPAAPTAPAAGGNAPARGGLEAEVEARRRAADQEAQAKARAEEQKLGQQRAENCRRARSHLSALESGQRMARMNDKGEREVLDDKGRAEEMRTARDVIASDCR